MNKYEKALQQIEIGRVVCNDITDAMSTLKELVERATPKKVIDLHPLSKHKELHKKCPNCREVHVPKYTYRIGYLVNFCPNCGQALLWNDQQGSDE